jgi:lysophospholipase L1-like esterase
MKYNKAFENLHLLEVENCRELYAIHGLHLNRKGEEVMAAKIVNVIKDILLVKISAPIGIK